MVDEAGLPAFDRVAGKVRRAPRRSQQHHRPDAHPTRFRLPLRETLIPITMLKRSGLCPTFPVAHPGTPAANRSSRLTPEWISTDSRKQQ